MEAGPSMVAPYCGQNQQQQINVPATIAYKYIDWEEGPWAMIPYASLYPQPAPTGAALPWPAPAGPMESREVFLPPRLSKTDLWSAMQVWPL